MLWLCAPLAAAAATTASSPAATQAAQTAEPRPPSPARHYLEALRAVDLLPAGTDSPSGHAPPPLPSPAWQPVSLPDAAPRSVAGETADDHRLRIAWYAVSWAGSRAATGDAADDDPIALYLPRAVGWAVQIWWHGDDGVWHALADNRTGWREQWNRPLLVPIPDAAWQSGGALTLAVGVPFADGAHHAIASLWVGPLSSLQPRANGRTTLQSALPQAASLAMAALGALSFAVWVRRRFEPSYLYFAGVSVLWPLRNLHHFVDMPRDDALYDWFWWASNASLSWVMYAVYLFAFRFDTRRYPVVERIYGAVVVAVTLATFPVWPFDVLLALHALNAVTALFVTGFLSLLAVRGGSHELRVIVAALWACLLFGAHDWMLVGLRLSPESVYLLPYGSMLLIASFLYAAWRRFIGAIEQVESANVVLARTLAERERELEANHLRLRRIEREQAVWLERQRLMRDMHDGVGSALITTLRVVEHGSFDRIAVADVLRSAVEDLRVTIDSLEPIERDLTVLLATLRTRMGRRLEGAGLDLQWAMDDLPALEWLDATQALQVLRLLQEALANVIKHAQARTVAFSASVDGEDVVVRVDDDGRGFDASAARAGRGLQNMRQRARHLGGELDIQTAPGAGVRLTLRLPIRAAADAAPTPAPADLVTSR